MPRRGFTLLEVAIALALLGILIAVVVPAFGALSGAELKKTSGMVQGLCRDTYARTALSGNGHRIVFDMDQNAFWVEGTQGGVVMKREKLIPDPKGRAELDPLDERLEGLEDDDDPEAMEKKRLYAGPTWAPIDDEMGEPFRLENDVRIHAVWADHLDERATAGQVAVHFFPGGYAQEAHISLSDDEAGDRTLTVLTDPLTGETFIEDEIPEVPVF